MSEKPHLKWSVRLKGSLTVEEQRVFNKRVFLLLGIGILGISLNFLVQLLNWHSVLLGWLALGFILCIFLWGMVGVLPYLLEIPKRERESAPEK